MSKKQTVFSIIITLLMAAFLVMSPRFIIDSRTLITLQREPTRHEEFQGIITVWHIVGFKPYKGSLGSWVNAVAAETEKKHSGVYFEVDSITVEDYIARTERGEQPDVFSFPLGGIYTEQLYRLDYAMPVLRGNLSNAGYYGTDIYAVPYGLSGYLMLQNQRLMQEKGMDAEQMCDAVKNGTATIAGDAVAACLYGATGELADPEAFTEQKVMAAFADARAAGDLERKLQNGKGFPVEVVQCGNYTDLVQFIGANANIEKEKLPYVYELMGNCLNEKNQLKLADIGMMPVLAQITLPKAENQAVQSIFDQLADAAVPNSFLYKTYRDQLYLSADEALQGSDSAKKDLHLRITELVRGAAIK